MTRPLGPVPRSGLRAFLDIDRVDVAWLVVLVVGSFVLRVASPIFPDWLTNPLRGAPVTAYGLGQPYNTTGCANAPADGSGAILPGQTAGASPLEVIPTPDQNHCGMVFDEVYFPVDAAKDAQTPIHDYFDPEPPLTKLLMAPGEVLLGFGTWSWRITQAVFGSLLVGVVYLIARRLRSDRFFAVVASLVMSLDGLAFVESRVGIIDVIAVAIAAFALYGFLLHWAARTRWQWLITLYAFATLVGLAFGAKLTAIAPGVLAGGLISARLLEPSARRLLRHVRRGADPGGSGGGEAALWRDAAGEPPWRWWLWLLRSHRGVRRPRGWFLHYAFAGLLAVLVMTCCYSRYLTVDHTLANFDQCQPATGPTTNQSLPTDDPTGRTPKGYTLYSSPRIDRGPLTFLGDIYHDVRGEFSVSIQYHSVECRTHPYASRWYTWPVQAHPVLLYVGSAKSSSGIDETTFITNLGNPAIWWLAIPALLYCVWAMTAGLRTRWRLATLALLAVSLALMVVSFHANELAPSVGPQVAPGKLFLVGAAGMVFFGAWGLWCAVARRRLVPSFIVLGYLAAWLMWFSGNEKRVLFSYHMLGALPFMALAIGYALTALRRASVSLGDHVVIDDEGRPVRRSVTLPIGALAWAGVIVVVAAFVFFYPIWTGAPQTTADHDMRMWFDSWVSSWNPTT